MLSSRKIRLLLFFESAVFERGWDMIPPLWRCALIPNLRTLGVLPERSDPLIVPPCPDGVVERLSDRRCDTQARWLRESLEDPDVAFMLLAYRYSRCDGHDSKYVAYECKGVQYGIDDLGAFKMIDGTRHAISPEELFSDASEAFGLWERFESHIEGVTYRFIDERDGTAFFES